MKKISELQTGYIDAHNYSQRGNKDFFNQIFVKNIFLDKLCESNISFLIGEKGTGKTAYATFLANNQYNNICATTVFIKSTDYSKFLKIKRENHLELSNFEDIWKVIILLLISQQIKEKEQSIFTLVDRFLKFRTLNKCIDKYYSDAFSPEVLKAIDIVENSKLFAEAMYEDYIKAGVEKNRELTFQEQRFITNLAYIQRSFEDALKQLKLDKNHILFIDGIDIRPDGISFNEYKECIKGLANAVWTLNSAFFPNIRDSVGRLRVVLLLRPDIFNILNLHNANAKLSDNSVFLDWRTDYAKYRTSEIFSVFDKFLSAQQDSLSLNNKKHGDVWDYYFNWEAKNIYDENINHGNTSFLSFLRNSYYRPRDILHMISLLQKNNARSNDDFFQYIDFKDPNFQRKYSNYLLGEIKDHLLFYYNEDDYNIFLKFFTFLNGRSEFSYSEYEQLFPKVIEYVDSLGKNKPQFMANQNEFLQFLFDLNIISFVERTTEGENHIHWCFKDREYGNISPQIKIGAGVRYQVFYGLAKALNLGSSFK